MFNEEDIKEQIKLVEPHDEYSFCQGFLMCAKLFGIWDNGEIIVGSSSVKEIRDAIRKYLKLSDITIKKTN